ncbi:hypothetical protein BC939DRAFT_97045 [Gamsiella multidivaricata]|uniref:uncharacterized protein n=1 Tax=Gamsiella multidivaricata TaxID=101098 RepID=UPI00221FD74D|nr:uncharacterized protein BC939DRAFT_97045 [Gamsiella multidivaricata]KAI7815730.1 hypothetical protein BC939DRAFT_97045 [Gamsiella multidivaricata]
MAANTLTLFCVISGELPSRAFPVELSPDKAVGVLKEAIIEKNPNAFEHIDAKDLVLWRATISIDENAGNESIITLDGLDDKTKLGNPRTCLSKLFPESPDDTTYIIVERPLAGVDPEVAVLRKQLSDMLDGLISVGIVVKPERKAVCNWSAMVDTVTVRDLKEVLARHYPQYDHDDYVEIHFYKTYIGASETIRDDEDLRRILRVAKIQSMKKMIISLDTPTKGFSTWTFKDVCIEYNLSESPDPQVPVVLPPFTGIKAALLHSNFQKTILEQLLHEIESRAQVMRLTLPSEATKSIIVTSFLVAATRLFEEDLYLATQRNLSGRRGNGPVDFSVHSRCTHEYTLGVTEVKKEDFNQGVAQNIVQLESALTLKKRKRERYEIDGEEEPPRKLKSYGIVTDASQWMFIECTMHEDDAVVYRMTELERTLNYHGKWQDDAKFVFERLVWLWSKMRDEISAREEEDNSRKASSLPSDRKTDL